MAAGSRRAHHQVTFAVLALGIGAFALLQSLVVPVLTTVQHQLHTSQDTVTWVLTVATGMNANIRTIGGSIGAAVMASIVTSQLGPSGLPEESGYTTGFAVMAAGLVLAALAGLLIPAARGRRRGAGELDHAELAMVAGGTITGDESE